MSDTRTPQGDLRSDPTPKRPEPRNATRQRTQTGAARPLAITRAQLEALQPCALDRRLTLFGKKRSLNVAQAFEAGATIRDVLWVLGRLGHKAICVEFAIGCAKRAQPAQPSAEALAAIRAAEAWLAEPTEGNAQRCRAAARAADWAAARAAAADAARAADWAAYAAAYAYAADWAADAAAYAAYAAADAAYAADAAVAERQAQREHLIALTSREA
jgi:hypothetical protein